MSDYIKREDALFVAYQQPFYSVVSQIKQLDGIDIVRCKECKYERDGEEFMWCEHPNGLDSIVKPDDFCSYGEREDK